MNGTSSCVCVCDLKGICFVVVVRIGLVNWVVVGPYVGHMMTTKWPLLRLSLH